MGTDGTENPVVHAQDYPHLRDRRILCLTKYAPLGASSRMRFHQYEKAFRAAGTALDFKPLLTDGYVQDLYAGRSRNYGQLLSGYAARVAALMTAKHDLLWIEKELFPYLPGAFERLAMLGGSPYVVDFDDAIFHNYDLHRKRSVRRLLSNRLDPLLSGSAMVTAGNDYLASYAARHGADRVETIPTVVEGARYAGPPAVRNERIRIGWIGTASNADYLAPAIRALEAINEELPVELVTVGIPALSGIGLPHEAHPWSEDTEVGLVQSFDIGIMPLTDTPWERGKCGYKLIQCMAAGRPVIASAVGANLGIVTPEVGRLVRTEDEWFAAFRELAGSFELRATMGAAGRERVARYYSLEAVAPRLLAAFDDLLREGPPQT